MRVRVLNICCLFFLLISGLSFAQEKKSKADILFFEYAYSDAVAEYLKESVKAPLSNQQQLNLGDSYLKLGNYKKAVDTYLQVYKRDTTMSEYHFNRMLVAMGRTSGRERVKAFLGTKRNSLANELLENADFNLEILQSGVGQDLEYTISHLNANSPQSDFSPAFYGDKLLFASSRPQGSRKEVYNPSGEGYLDIFIGKVGRDGQILNPNPFTAIPDSRFHEATPYYSSDLNGIFYIRSNVRGKSMVFDENGKNALAIGLKADDGSFDFLLRDLSTSFYYPFYDAETEKLYFAANFDDSLGGTDIYFVYTVKGQIRSSPINLGPRINTPGNEISPYIHNNSLYFSSDIFYGLGGMDVYKSEMGSDDFFSIPVNLGKGINTEKDDFAFILKDNAGGGLMGYFASNRVGGQGKDDIYRFQVDGEPGIKTLIFRGKLTKAGTSFAVPGATIQLLDKEDNLIKEVMSENDGSYRMEVPWRDYARITIAKDQYSFFSETYDKKALETMPEDQNLDVDLSFLEDLLRKTEGKTVVRLNKFFFDKNLSTVTPTIAAELDKFVEVAKGFPDLQFNIEAHTDSRGGTATNLRLSQQRADAIKQYLLSKGVQESSIKSAVGYGEDQIVNNCKNGVYCLEVLHKQNERHLIVVENYDLSVNN